MVSQFTATDPDIKVLLEISEELFDIGGATALLHWDQETYMPPKGVLHRSRQLSTLSAIYHARLIDQKTGEAIKKLEGKNLNETDAALVREMKRAYDRATRLPESLVREMAKAQSVGLESWKEARNQNKFSVFKGSLQKIIELKIEETRLIGYKDSPYDCLLDEYEPSLTTAQIEPIFEYLKKEIVQILKKHKNKRTKEILRGKKYSKNSMIKITEAMLKRMGYDFEEGRQDLSAHPFTINFGNHDVRITNRYLKNDLGSSIFSAIHEGGHALYELGISENLGGSILAAGTSLGIHESQSRMWENMIGRSLPYWKFWAPLFKASPREIYDEVNKVSSGLIRVDADEITYNLHIAIRFEIEKDLIEEKIKVIDLPEIWKEKYQRYLGVTPPDDASGILQDIHWAQGSIGYFPTYTLGNLYAAQFWHEMKKDIKDLNKHIESGNFAPILNWLRQNIHQYGSIYQARDLVLKVSKNQLDPGYFVNYLKAKFC